MSAGMQICGWSSSAAQPMGEVRSETKRPDGRRVRDVLFTGLRPADWDRHDTVGLVQEKADPGTVWQIEVAQQNGPYPIMGGLGEGLDVQVTLIETKMSGNEHKDRKRDKGFPAHLL